MPNKIYTLTGAAVHLITPPEHPQAAEGYRYPKMPRLYLFAEAGAWRFREGDHTALGAELVTNGAFAADTDWTKGTGWTIAAGKATSDASQSGNSDLEQDTDDTGAELVEGEIYTVVFTTSGRSAGNVRAVLGGTAGTNRSTNATFTEDIVCGADGKIIIRADLDFDGSVDNLSVKKAVMTYDATPPAAPNGTGSWNVAAQTYKDIPTVDELTVIGADSNAILSYYWGE